MSRTSKQFCISVVNLQLQPYLLLKYRIHEGNLLWESFFFSILRIVCKTICIHIFYHIDG